MSAPVSRRDRAICYFTERMNRRGGARLQMFFYLTVCTLVMVLTSFYLHTFGVNSMTFRYPLSISVAYVLFLVLLGHFVSHHRARHRKTIASRGHFFNADVTIFPHSPSSHIAADSITTSGSCGSGPGFSLDVGGGDGILVVLMIAITGIVTLLTTGLVLYNAPLILAEILTDGALFVQSFGHNGSMTPQNWLFNSLRRTGLPFVIMAGWLTICGLALETLAPKATTMFQAYRITHPQS